MRDILLPALFPLREEPHSKLSFLRLESCPSKLFLDFDQKGSMLSLLSCPKNSLLDLLWVTNLIPLPGQNDLLQPIAKRQEKGAGKTKPRHLHSQKRVPRNSEGSAQIEEKSKGRYLIYDTIFFERAGFGKGYQ